MRTYSQNTITSQASISTKSILMSRTQLSPLDYLRRTNLDAYITKFEVSRKPLLPTYDGLFEVLSRSGKHSNETTKMAWSQPIPLTNIPVFVSEILIRQSIRIPAPHCQLSGFNVIPFHKGELLKYWEQHSRVKGWLENTNHTGGSVHTSFPLPRLRGLTQGLSYGRTGVI